MENKFKVGDLVKVVDSDYQYKNYKSFYEVHGIPMGNFVEGRDVRDLKDYRNVVFSIKDISSHSSIFLPHLYLIENRELKLEFIFSEKGLKLFQKKISKEKQLTKDLRKFCKKI